MALRRQRAGIGSSTIFFTQRTAVKQWPDLTAILAPISWAVVGAVATRLYMPERMTQDFDIAIATAEINAACNRLATAGYQKLENLSIGGSCWRAPDGVYLDIIEGIEPWWPQALAAAQHNLDPQGLPILPLSYLVLMKFNASRVIDLGDITRMLGLADTNNLTRVRELFQDQAPDALEDLESLIFLGQLEINIGKGVTDV